MSEQRQSPYLEAHAIAMLLFSLSLAISDSGFSLSLDSQSLCPSSVFLSLSSVTDAAESGARLTGDQRRETARERERDEGDKRVQAWRSERERHGS